MTMQASQTISITVTMITYLIMVGCASKPIAEVKAAPKVAAVYAEYIDALEVQVATEIGETEYPDQHDDDMWESLTVLIEHRCDDTYGRLLDAWEGAGGNQASLDEALSHDEQAVRTRGRERAVELYEKEGKEP